MANKSLGTLTLDLVAKIGGFTAGMTEAERAAEKSSKEIEKSLRGISTASVAVGTAIGQVLADGIRAAVDAFPELIDQAAAFQDIADKTGGSAEGFANFAVSAKVAGVGMDEIAQASVRLSKALIGVDDESKAAGAGLSALGISIKDFKTLSADQQIKRVAEAFAEYRDGTEKAAVAQQIFGKSGADLLKFFKDYTDNGGDVNILTADMIQKADDFGDAQTRLRAEISLFASALATNFIDPLTIVIGLVKDAVREVYGLDVAASKTGANSGVKEFAEAAGRALATAIDYVTQSVREFQVLTDFVSQTAKALSQVAKFDFSGASETGEQFRKKYGLDDFGRKIGDAGAVAGKTYVQKFNDEISRQNAERNRKLLNAVNYGSVGDTRPRLGVTPPTGKGGKKDNSAAQEAKAQLDADLSAIKDALREQAGLYANQEKILEATRAAGLTDERDYYQQKRDLLEKNTEAQVQAQQGIIDRLREENLTGKEAIDNAKKIAEAQSQLNKIQADGATQAKVLGIQEDAAYRKTASAILAARQAAQDYFDTVNQGYESTLAGIGKGSKNRDFNAALQQINEKYQQQRQDLANRRSQAELLSGGTLGATEAKQFDEQLAIINEFQSKALESYKRYYASLDAAQDDWKNGATEALRNYADEAANTAKLTEDAFSNAFKGLEDTLLNFVKTGKLNFKDLADSIITDFLRIAIKQQITGPLASGLSGAIGGGGFFGSLFGGGGGGGDVLGDFIAANGFASGGFTGYGRPDEIAGVVHKGEYVLDAKETAAIGVGNLERGYVGGLTVNFALAGQMDRDTQMQAAQRTARETQTAVARYK